MAKHPPDPSRQPGGSIQPDTVPVPGPAGLEAIDLLDRHRNLVMGAALAAALIICGGLVAREMQRQKRSNAAQAFSTAAAERSLEKLEEVASQHKGTLPAGNALLAKADLELSQEKPDDARVTLLRFLDQHGKHPRHAQGLYALANLHHRAGEFDEARGYYERAMAADSANELGPLILLRQGDIALAEADALRADGKADEAGAKVTEARQHYEESITRPEFRANPFFEMAESRLALTEVGDVPVVPAPPEPEPESAPAPDAPAPAPDAPAAPAAPAPAPDAPAPVPDAPAPAPQDGN